MIVCFVLAVIVIFPVLFYYDLSKGSFVFRFSNPVEEYARSKGLSEDMMKLLNPLIVNSNLNTEDTMKFLNPLIKNINLNSNTKTFIDELSVLGNYTSSPLVHSAIVTMLSDGVVNNMEASLIQDVDNDYVINKLEISEYHTDPTNIYTSGLNLDDFNAIFTYGIDPKNQTAVKMVLGKVPDVEVRHWEPKEGGIESSNEKFIEISMRDPLLQHLAKKSEIRWRTIPNSEKRQGTLFVDGEILLNSSSEQIE
ncbi:hypothetical protein MUP38_02720 [Candidatus Bathyarchaeota archaeon]|nr:hypothetical protein [Candidatus Bathyarchaeota archaeon]